MPPLVPAAPGTCAGAGAAAMGAGADGGSPVACGGGAGAGLCEVAPGIAEAPDATGSATGHILRGIATRTARLVVVPDWFVAFT